MRILFDMGHPADYYLFLNVIKRLRERGDEILIVVRNREGIAREILQQEGEGYVLLGENVKGMLNKAIYMLRNDAKLLRIASRFKADMFVSLGSPYSGHVSFFMRRPHVSFSDTQISWLMNLLLAPPFAISVLTPASVDWKVKFRNFVYINGTKELAYLSPRYYTPDPSILKELGISKDDKIIIIRFSAHDSHHDIGLKNMSDESKKRLVDNLSKQGRVYISTEVALQSELQPFVLRIKKMHDLLSYASLFIGEGSTMASEAAVLGVPTIFIHPKDFGYIEDHKKFGLVVQYRNPENEIGEIIDLSNKILMDEGSKAEFIRKRNEMLDSKEDVVLRIIGEIDKHRKDRKGR